MSEADKVLVVDSALVVMDSTAAVMMAEAVATAVRTVEGSEARREEVVGVKVAAGLGDKIAGGIVGTIVGTSEGVLEEMGVRFLTSMSLDSDDASASPEALEVTPLET